MSIAKWKEMQTWLSTRIYEAYEAAEQSEIERKFTFVHFSLTLFGLECCANLVQGGIPFFAH